jgi:two-component system sensor histidine kinase VicK
MTTSTPLSAPEPAAQPTTLPAPHDTPTDLREQLVEAVRYEQSQARFRAVFENSPLGQKIITSDLTIRQVNPATLQMLGFAQAEQLVGHKILEFAHPDHRADWHELQKRLWEHKLPSFSLETCLVRADGSSFWCQVHSVLVPDEEGELGYTILENISERKALEEKLKRLYDAQETIVQLVSHDLKAPVAQIELLVDLLLRELAGRQGEAPPPPEMVHYFTLIRLACAQANGLLQDALYVGDLDEQGLEKTPTDMNGYLRTQLEVYRLAAQEKSVKLAVALPEETLYASLHPEKFARVLANLVGNALKFTPAGGTVTIGLEKQADKLRITVRDTGIGIPGRLHANLFDKFNPARRAGLSGETTTGLGLFIARQIVQLHGGHIWLESREQEGTAFFIELP